MIIEQPINRPEKGVFIHRHMFKFEKMNKGHIVWLSRTLCKAHNVQYIKHPRCYFRDLELGLIPQTHDQAERIGFLDIEASNLKGTFGYMFSYCIKKLDAGVLIRQVVPTDIRNQKQWLDRDLCIQFCQDIKQFDRLVVYWGKDYRYDVPFMRTRTLYWKQIALRDGDTETAKKLNFPVYMELYVEDLYDVVKKKFRLHNNRLATFCMFFNIEAKGHPLNPEMWNRALAGHQDAIDYIVIHNTEDVHSTETAWKITRDFIRRPGSSI